MPILLGVDQLLGNAELRLLLGVNRQRVTQLVAAADFPRPRAVLSMGSIWSLPDVEAWAAKKGRTLHLDRLAAADPDAAKPADGPRSGD